MRSFLNSSRLALVFTGAIAVGISASLLACGDDKSVESSSDPADSSAETIEIDGKLYMEIECDPSSGGVDSSCGKKDEGKLAYCESTKYHEKLYFECSAATWRQLSVFDVYPPTETCDGTKEGKFFIPEDNSYYARCESGSWKNVGEAQYKCQKFEAKEGSVCNVNGCISSNWTVSDYCYADDYFYSEKEGRWVTADEYEGDTNVGEVVYYWYSKLVQSCDEEGTVAKFTREDFPHSNNFLVDQSLEVIYGKCVGGVYRLCSEEEFSSSAEPSEKE